MSYASSWGGTGALTGAAGGGLLGRLGEILDTPRRALWSVLGGPERGEELPLIRDIENPLLRGILGFAAESTLDPLALGGAALGLATGAGLGTAADKVVRIKQSLEPAARESAMTRHLSERMQDALASLPANDWHIAREPGPTATIANRTIPAGIEELLDTLADPRAPYLAYSPEVTAALPRDFTTPAGPRPVRAAAGTVPEVAEHLARMGLGASDQEGNLLLLGPRSPGRVPGLEATGGWARLENLAGGYTPHNPLVYETPRLPRQPTYLEALAHQAEPLPQEAAFLRSLSPGLTYEQVPGFAQHAVDLPLDLGTAMAERASLDATRRLKEVSRELERMGPLTRLLWERIGPSMPRRLPDIPPISRMDPYWNRTLGS